MLYRFEDDYVFAVQNGGGLRNAFPAAVCVLGVVALLTAFGIGKVLLEVVVVAVSVWVIWQVVCGISWLLHEIPVSKGKQPPPPREEKPPKEKKTPKWLQILEGDGDDED